MKKYLLIIIIIVTILLLFPTLFLARVSYRNKTPNRKNVEFNSTLDNNIINTETQNEKSNNTTIMDNSNSNNIINDTMKAKEDTTSKSDTNNEDNKSSNDVLSSKKDDTKKQTTSKTESTTNSKKQSTKDDEPSSNDKKSTEVTKPKVEPEKPKVTESKECKHYPEVGNSGKWYNSKQDAINEYKTIIKEYGDKWKNDEMSDDEFKAKSPCGYDTWDCMYCGKYTINYHYRKSEE